VILRYVTALACLTLFSSRSSVIHLSNLIDNSTYNLPMNNQQTTYNHHQARKWEGGCLRGFVGRMGWISVSLASGAGAWSEGGSGGNNDIGGGSGPIGAVRAPSDPAAESSTPTFPTTGGRSLGSTSSRGLLSRGSKSPKTPEERAALLERAAERRRQQQEEADSAV
jgi:hypothetical protein